MGNLYLYLLNTDIEQDEHLTARLPLKSTKVSNIQLNLVTSSTDKVPNDVKIKAWTYFIFSLHISSCHLKLLVFESKFSGSRKFTLRYQQFEMNFDFETSTVACKLLLAYSTVQVSVMNINIVLFETAITTSDLKEKYFYTVDSRYLEIEGTLKNSSRYPYFDISDL